MNWVLRLLRGLLGALFVGVLYVVLVGLVLIGGTLAWRGVTGLVGGDTSSALSLATGALTVTGPVLVGSRIIRYVSVTLTGTDDLRDG